MAFHFIHQQEVSSPVLGGGMYNFGHVHSAPSHQPTSVNFQAPADYSARGVSFAGTGVSGGGAFASSIETIAKAMLEDKETQRKLLRAGRGLANEAVKVGARKVASSIGIPERVVDRAGEIIEESFSERKRRPEGSPNEERRTPKAAAPGGHEMSVSGDGLEDSVYCMKCKAKRKPKNVKIVDYTTKKGMKGIRLAGTCPVCGSGVSKILSSKKTSKSAPPTPKPAAGKPLSVSDAAGKPLSVSDAAKPKKSATKSKKAAADKPLSVSDAAKPKTEKPTAKSKPKKSAPKKVKPSTPVDENDKLVAESWGMKIE